MLSAGFPADCCMKDFQCFHKRDLAPEKPLALSNEVAKNFWQADANFFETRIRDSHFLKKDTAFSQVAVAYSVHVGEKIAHCWQRINSGKVFVTARGTKTHAGWCASRKNLG